MKLPLVRKSLTLSAAVCIAASAFVVSPSTAAADSCWNHNGSTMRLVAEDNQRWFYYEVPRQVLVNAGVQKGTLLFNGVKSGNWYSGTARRFSKFCPGTPLEYSVEGPVRSDQLQVTVRGQREVYSQCQPTGQFKQDELVFTWIGDC